MYRTWFRRLGLIEEGQPSLGWVTCWLELLHNTKTASYSLWRWFSLSRTKRRRQALSILEGRIWQQYIRQHINFNVVSYICSVNNVRKLLSCDGWILIQFLKSTLAFSLILSLLWEIFGWREVRGFQRSLNLPHYFYMLTTSKERFFTTKTWKVFLNPDGYP